MQETTAFVDSKEDMFVDAPEELNFVDTPLKEPALTTDDDNNVICIFFFLIIIQRTFCLC